MKRHRATTVDVLAVVAHPDDAELSCGGTLIKCRRQGYRTGVLDLTRGEMGTRGTPELRAREARAASRALGLHHRENLGLPDSRLEPTQENALAVAARLRALRPRVVILPYWEGRHPDHYHTSEIAYQACYLAGLKKLDLPGKPHRPFKVLYATLFDLTRPVTPTFVVDISREYERRARAVACYRSQFRGPQVQHGVHIPLTGIQQMMATLCGYYGSLIGVRYGEPFLTRETLQVENIVELPVRSL